MVVVFNTDYELKMALAVKRRRVRATEKHKNLMSTREENGMCQLFPPTPPYTCGFGATYVTCPSLIYSLIYRDLLLWLHFVTVNPIHPFSHALKGKLYRKY